MSTKRHRLSTLPIPIDEDGFGGDSEYLGDVGTNAHDFDEEDAALLQFAKRCRIGLPRDRAGGVEVGSAADECLRDYLRDGHYLDRSGVIAVDDDSGDPIAPAEPTNGSSYRQLSRSASAAASPSAATSGSGSGHYCYPDPGQSMQQPWQPQCQSIATGPDAAAGIGWATPGSPGAQLSRGPMSSAGPDCAAGIGVGGAGPVGTQPGLSATGLVAVTAQTSGVGNEATFLLPSMLSGTFGLR